MDGVLGQMIGRYYFPISCRFPTAHRSLYAASFRALAALRVSCTEARSLAR